MEGSYYAGSPEVVEFMQKVEARFPTKLGTFLNILLKYQTREHSSRGGPWSSPENIYKDVERLFSGPQDLSREFKQCLRNPRDLVFPVDSLRSCRLAPAEGHRGYLAGGEVKRVSSSPLGRGAYGVVFEGVHPQYGRVAIKHAPWLSETTYEENVKSYRREAKLWQHLHHPNVLQFIGIIEFPKQYDVWLVSELATDGPLHKYLASANGLRASRLRTAQEFASGLRYLHQERIVHGDVKSRNVLVRFGVIKIADFGLAKTSDMETTPSVKGAGSLRWQAPELLGGARRTYQIDVYASAMTLYEILSGNIPFAEFWHAIAVVTAIITKVRPITEPRSREGEDFAPLWDIVVKCWAEDPLQRPAMIDVERELLSLGTPEAEAEINLLRELPRPLDMEEERSLESEFGLQDEEGTTDSKMQRSWMRSCGATGYLGPLPGFFAFFLILLACFWAGRSWKDLNPAGGSLKLVGYP